MTTAKKAASILGVLALGWLLAPVFWSIFDHLTTPIVEALSK